ncbi:MAG: hypothetical protein HY925_01460 [Elusimicrobia bacterium]|nr:hypothetical protein [Elusimicrobiota bacterium]
MRGPALAALILVSAFTARAADPSPSPFSADESWMLSVVLSDPDQKRAYDADSAAAAAGDAAAKATFENRWRKRIVEFANAYHQQLSSKDITPNAPSVERMVDDWEFNVMNYWLSAQTPKKRQEVMKDIADGNSVLGFMRGTVESRVRENRKKAAEEMARYVVSPKAVAALKYVEPPARTIDVARRAAGNGRAADTPGATPEETASRAGQTFNGAAPQPGDSASPVDATRPAAPPVPAPASGGSTTERTQGGLTAPVTSSPGGFRVAPPPSPLVARDNTAPKEAGWKVLARKAAPAAGGILGAIIGFLVAGPIGALIGAVGGAALGYGAKKVLS